MGAYNILFYFDKLSKKLPKRQPRLAPDHEYLVPAPIPLVIIEPMFIFIFWASLTYIVLQEMSIGQRGNTELIYYHFAHLTFGGICPVAAGFLLNREVYLGRHIAVPFIIATSIFYIYALWQQSFGEVWKYSGASAILVANIALFLYLFRNRHVCKYFDSLRPARPTTK